MLLRANVIVLAGMFCLLTGAPAPASEVSGHGAALSEIRAATSRFHLIDNALTEGYGQFLGCTSQPGAGAMGIHFVNGTYVGDVLLDPATPEALTYEPQPNGQLRLVGVEYIVFAQPWDDANALPPSLFGQQFHLVPFPNRYGIPAFYELHVWLWRNNPQGIFEDWNPEVNCP